jgi:intracellular sulfur oxidation DsrE/DsrF family protein
MKRYFLIFLLIFSTSASRSNVQIVLSGVAEVARMQAKEGFVYLRL